jgi:putative SOS response-associated peptidase YedK
MQPVSIRNGIQEQIMCGRFALPYPSKTVAEHFSISEEVSFASRYNIAPSQNIAVVRGKQDAPGLQMAMMRWGLIPNWAKDERLGYKMINARAETVAEKPAFRSAYRQRRCLIAAGGFYEWQRQGKNKQPYFLTVKEKKIFAFAGIWERWQSPVGEPVESCAILTTAANSSVRTVHDRMPVIVAPTEYNLWIDPVWERDILQQILRFGQLTSLRIYPVSDMVNSPQNDSPSCIQEILL